MNEAEFSIQTPTDNVLELDQAVLLYHGRSGSALATVHEVISVDGAPVISAGRAMTALWVDQLAARGQVIRRNQPGLRHGDKIRVGQIALAVGKRQPAGFAIQMHGVGRGGRQGVQLKTRQHAQ